jgi:hypothetical protein
VLWPDERYRNNDVRRENLVDTKFGDYSLPCPRNADKYLDAMYGKDWREIGRSQSYDHITRKNQGRSIMILVYLKRILINWQYLLFNFYVT